VDPDPRGCGGGPRSARFKPTLTYLAYRIGSGHDHGVGDAVGHRVEEGTPRPRRAARLGHRAVEDVGAAGDEQRAGGEQEVAAAQGETAGDRGRQPEQGDLVGGEAGLTEAGAEGAKLPLDLRPPALIEH